MDRAEKVSIDEVFDHFQQLDVDTSGKVSKRELERFLAGDDIRHTFIAAFETADTGITWDDGTNGSIIVTAIEPGSPAAENEDIVVGLALASVNGAALPDGGVQMLKKAWRALLVSRQQIALEFYEPFVIVHDFAQTLDLEIDNSRKKHILKANVVLNGPMLVGPLAPIFTLLTKLRGLFFHESNRGHGHMLSAQKQLLCRTTARVKMRAYAFASDMGDALDDALFLSAPQNFKLGSTVSADNRLGTLSIQSDRSPFRLLTTDGPTWNTSLYRHLAFDGKCTNNHTYSLKSKARVQMSLQLGFKSSEQVRTFTTELLQEFDSNQNSWLEFDEFRKLYTMYLADEMARNALQTRVKVRFRSEEELRALADERLMLQRRRQLKTELEARREANHAVRKQQKKNMANSNYLDCDGLVRRGKLATDEHKAENVPSIVTGGKDSGASQQRRKRRSDLRNKQKQRCPVKMPCQKSVTITDVKTRVPQHDVIHPSFAGRAHAPKSTNFNTHPIFCGLDRIPQCIPQPVSAVRSLTSIYDFNDTRDKNMEMWRLFLSPPLCRGLMRQHHREWATAHDRSENIHPAFWGSLVASNAIFANESFTCPALFGYSFRQQSGGGGQPTRQSTAQTHLPFTSFKESTCAQVLKPCLICLGGQFGCPSCFGLPAGLDLHECSFMPGDTISKKCDSQNSLHTDLTTRESLVHDRCVRHSRVDVLIKSVPCGAAVKLTLVSDDTVSHLHHLFRASSAYGAESLTLIAVPVERGLIDMNLSSFSLPGPSEGKISLHRYGLNKTGARAVLFHGRHHLTWSMIGTFIKNNMSCGVWPVSFTHMPMSHLDHAPATLPGTDSVQKELFKILKVKKTIPV